MPPRNPVATPATQTDPRPLRLAAAVGWLVLFCVAYFSLPVETRTSLRRSDLLILSPDLIAEAIFPTPGQGLPSGLRFLPQRFDIVAVALLNFCGACGFGFAVLHGMFPARSRAAGFGATDLSPLSRAEFVLFGCGLGLSLWSLVTLGLGMAGLLHRGLFLALLAMGIVAGAWTLWRRRGGTERSPDAEPLPRWFVRTAVGVTLPFLIAAALAAMLPPFEFDTKEYHLGGPKEFFLDGRIHFLPHNVYTSFPFLTEMLSLSAMVLRGDWYRGALAGQLTLFAFLPLTALAIFAAGRRLFGTAAGLCGAAVYATSPWAYRLAVIPFVEGALNFFVAVTLAGVAIASQTADPRMFRRLVALIGFLAGGGMACKYPGVVQVVFPMGLALAGLIIFRNSDPTAPPSAPRNRLRLRGPFLCRSLLITAALYTAGVLVAVGPWLLKNLWETGNPVYPLLWTLFGGADWDTALNAKFRAGHSPSNFSPGDLARQLFGVTLYSPWQTPLAFGLAPLALLGPHRTRAGWLWLQVGYLFAAWWLLTHRIDRFWVPLLPIVCCLAGGGAVAISSRLWRGVAGTLAAAAIVFNLAVATSDLSGNSAYLADLNAVHASVETPALAALGRVLPADANVLLVGEAEIFDARFSYRYNTVFDRNLIEQWVYRDPNAESPVLQSADEIRAIFADQGVTQVFINWNEIARYRGTYGFSPNVTPELFQELERLGVLTNGLTLAEEDVERLDPGIAAQLRGPLAGLLHERGGETTATLWQLYDVTGSPAE